MSAVIDLRGRRFGRLRVLRRGENYLAPCGCTKARWICRCDCGAETLVMGASLARGLSESCGCLHNEQVTARSTRHGAARKKRKSDQYVKWSNSKRGRKAGVRFEQFAARG